MNITFSHPKYNFWRGGGEEIFHSPKKSRKSFLFSNMDKKRFKKIEYRLTPHSRYIPNAEASKFVWSHVVAPCCL